MRHRHPYPLHFYSPVTLRLTPAQPTPVLPARELTPAVKVVSSVLGVVPVLTTIGGALESYRTDRSPVVGCASIAILPTISPTQTPIRPISPLKQTTEPPTTPNSYRAPGGGCKLGPTFPSVIHPNIKHSAARSRYHITKLEQSSPNFTNLTFIHTAPRSFLRPVSDSSFYIHTNHQLKQ